MPRSVRRPVSYMLSGCLEVVQSPLVPEDGFRFGVTGGRDFYDSKFIWESLTDIHRQHHITELGGGCATGVDHISLEWASRHRVPWRCYAADWDVYGDAAGAIRNQAYLDDFQPHRLGVFPGGRGTTDCARRARKMKIERDFFHPDSDPLSEALRWG